MLWGIGRQGFIFVLAYETRNVWQAHWRSELVALTLHAHFLCQMRGSNKFWRRFFL